MRAVPEPRPRGRVGIGKPGPDEVAVQGDAARRVSGRLQGEPVGLRLVAARDGVGERLGQEDPPEGEGEAQGHEPRPEAAEPVRDPGQQEDAGNREEREPCEPLPQVPALHVGQLVGGDEPDLALAEAPVEQSVVEDDPAGRAEPGDVGVGGGRPPARVCDEHLVDVDAEILRERLDLGRERTVGKRLEAVEERLHDERLHDEEDTGDRDQSRRADEPPAAPETSRPARPRRRRRSRRAPRARRAR